MSLHKSGSTFQNKIYSHINRIAGQQICFSRAKINWLQVLYSKHEELNNIDIIVIRNPINRLISHYYSAFYAKNKDDKNIKNYGNTSLQKEMRSHTLSEWIVREDFLLKHKNIYDFILSSNNLNIIKYEDMMDEPEKFISFILKKINKLDLLEIVYNKFKDEFAFDKPDLSDQIVNEGLISHRRILDRNEYLKKFTKQELEIINSALGDTLYRYNNIKSFT